MLLIPAHSKLQNPGNNSAHRSSFHHLWTQHLFFFFSRGKSQLPHAYESLLHTDKPRLWACYSDIFVSRHNPTHLYKWFQKRCFTKQASGTNHMWIKPKSWARKRRFSLLFPVSQHGSLLKFLVLLKMRYFHCSCPIRSANIHIRTYTSMYTYKYININTHWMHVQKSDSASPASCLNVSVSPCDSRQ